MSKARLFERAQKLEDNQHEIDKIDAQGAVDIRKEFAKG